MNVRRCLRATAALTGGLVAAKYVKQEFSKSWDWKATHTGIKFKVPEIALPLVFAEPKHAAAEHLWKETGMSLPYLTRTPHFSIIYSNERRNPHVTHEYLTRDLLLSPNTSTCNSWVPDPRYPTAEVYSLPANSDMVLAQMVPSRNHPYDPTLTHLFTNAIEMPRETHGKWLQLEDHTRNLALYPRNGNEGVHVFSGPFYEGDYTKTKKCVPAGFFKVIIEKKEIKAGSARPAKPYHMRIHILRTNLRGLYAHEPKLHVLDEMTDNAFNWNGTVFEECVSGDCLD